MRFHFIIVTSLLEVSIRRVSDRVYTWLPALKIQRLGSRQLSFALTLYATGSGLNSHSDGVLGRDHQTTGVCLRMTDWRLLLTGRRTKAASCFFMYILAFFTLPHCRLQYCRAYHGTWLVSKVACQQSFSCVKTAVPHQKIRSPFFVVAVVEIANAIASTTAAVTGRRKKLAALRYHLPVNEKSS